MDDANKSTPKEPCDELADVDGERELGSYRQPAAEPNAAPQGSGAPRQSFGVFPGGPLGSLEVSLDLGVHLEVSVNRRALRVDAGGGLHVTNSRELPEIVVRSLDLDLGTLDLDLDADGLGGAFGFALGVAGNELALHRFGFTPSPQQTLVDHWLTRQASDPSGRRQVFAVSGARTSLWLDPDVDLRIRVDRQAAELSLSEALRVVVLGVGIGIAAARYIFAARRIELDRGPGLRGLLSAPILALVAWIASRWLRRQLPAPVGVEGYDPWSDEDRLRHLRSAFLALRPAETEAAATPEPALDPSLPSLETLTADLTADAPGPEVWLIARVPIGPTVETEAPLEAPNLASIEAPTLAPNAAPSAPNLAPNLAPNAVPPEPEAPVSPSRQPMIGIGASHGGSIHAEISVAQIRLRADGGLFVYADGQPTLQRLRILDASFDLASETLEVTTDPALGSLPQATLAQLARDHWRRSLDKLPQLLQELLRAGRERPLEPLSWRRDLGEGRSMTLLAPADVVIRVDHSEAATELNLSPGVELRWEGLPLPDVTLQRLRYGYEDGDVEVSSEPALGPLEHAALRHFLHHRLAPRLSPALRSALRFPAGDAPTTEVAVGERTHAAYSVNVAEVGSVQLLLDPADTITADLDRAGLVVQSERGLLLSVGGIDLHVDLQALSLSFDGAVRVTAEPAPGPVLIAILEDLYRDKLAPHLGPWSPPNNPDEPWTLVRRSIGDLDLDLVLSAGDAIGLRRDADGLSLGTREGLLLRDPQLGPGSPVTIRSITWAAATDSLGVSTSPEAGDLLHEVAEHLVRQLGRPVLDRLRDALALPEGPALPPPPPAPQGSVLLRRPLPRIGDFELALKRGYFVMLTADAERHLSVTIEGGLRGRVRKLGLQVILEELEYSADSNQLLVTSTPALGDLESALLTTFARRLIGLVRGHLWPDDAAPGVLAILARDSTQGPATLSLPPGASLRVALDRQMLEVECEAGLLIDLAGASWLPMIRLEKLSYTLADGALDLRFGGIEERHYHEAESVSTVTESILSDLLRVLVTPRFPAALEPLGLRRVQPPPLLTPQAGAIELFSVPLVPGYGEARLTMDPDETIVVTASEAEVELRCDRGLKVALPALRIRVTVMTARYHIPTGEVQVGGLGQLENAIIESVIRKNLKRPAPGGAPVADLIERLPVDDKGRRQLFANNAVSIRMRSGARFTLAFSAAGIDFTATPPLEVDGPAVLNYELRGFTYSFARARFSLILDDDGVLASLFTGVVADTVESQVNKLLRPLLPPSMREPGYSIADDPTSAENLAAVIANFSLLKKGGEPGR